jgi:3-dehydroquinate synthase
MTLRQSFSVHYEYNVFFTEHLFDSSNTILYRFFEEQHQPGFSRKVLFVIDQAVAENHPQLNDKIVRYFKNINSAELVQVLVIPGGEIVKNDESYLQQVINAISQYSIDRHSYVAAIGGGSVLDMAGYASAIAHRGVKHIRIPTTVLSQNDSGMGVKNGINCLGKKNFLGAFAPPAAVFNDAHFLTTLTERDWRSGIAEAVKVALIKDEGFFKWLEDNTAAMMQRNMAVMCRQIQRCAELHLQHIASGDPFEMGSSRPLDFGHWSAHKLEQLSNFTIRHGEAVAMGIALDSTYSYLCGWLKKQELERILCLLQFLGFMLVYEGMEVNTQTILLKGLNEFREHLGGQLSITLLKGIGHSEEVHEMDSERIGKASEWLMHYCLVKQKNTA